MNAIRRDEDMDNLHSTYVDQWDWEMIITKEGRNLETLKSIVRGIYSAMKKTEKYPAQPVSPPQTEPAQEQYSFRTTRAGGPLSGSIA